MTDNEIIKALECCSRADEGLYGGLTYKGESLRILIKEALDLINRQKAEIAELNREIENLESIQEISPEAKHFVDTKADKVISLLNEVIKSQEQIKAEAITEFAERLKAKAFLPLGTWCAEIVITENDVDQIAKEMKGEQ